MFRAGLSGTNWTGKTETIARFAQAHPDLCVETVSLSAIVARCPFPTVQDQTLEASEWIAGQVAVMCAGTVGPVQLFDRTPLDILAFTLYAQERAEQPGQHVVEKVIDLLEHFDTIFYVPVSDAWPSGIAPPAREVEFAREMDSYIRRAIDQFAPAAIAMPWDLGERQQLLSEHVPPVDRAGGDSP